MTLPEAIDQLHRAAQGADAIGLRAAAGAAAIAIAGAAGDGARATIDGTAYRVEEVTWPVSQHEDGHSAYPCPLPIPALVRGDTLLADVRENYTDGNTWYYPVAAKIGRWRRFRTGSPGERGYDLHLAGEDELRAFTTEVDRLLDALGLGGA